MAMKINQKYNTLTVKEYLFYVDNHKKYTDFNTLGLYRSIIENEKLSADEKIQVREHAHTYFKKAFDFLQLKDPGTFVKVSALGEEMTKADEEQVWENLKQNQQKILSDKGIKHRNFGVYSKHECPYDDCIWKGVMLKSGSPIAECNMHFKTDHSSYDARAKSDKRKTERKNIKQIISNELQME
jgi:hypothetical protein